MSTQGPNTSGRATAGTGQRANSNWGQSIFLVSARKIPETLERLGLKANDSAASDHLILVVDGNVGR